MATVTSHAAEASALGFYFQSFFGLTSLVGHDNDAAAVAIERGDDVELKAGNETLLFQLKHSMSAKPPAVTIASRAVWRTLKVWIDVLPNLSLAETRFHLVTVGEIPEGSPLSVLLDPKSSRTELAVALEKEAMRVRDEREAAAKANVKPLPHADRADGCAAFLELSPASRLNLLRRVRIVHGNLTIDQLENELAGMLSLIKVADRAAIARSLIEWWDRQVVYALCDRRPRFIARSEVLQQIAERVSDLEHDTLLADFSTMSPPSTYQPDGMLTRQIALVGGKDSDIARAINAEWRARQQRAKWIVERPGMAVKIDEHDMHMREEWSDKHKQMSEDCATLLEDGKCEQGLSLLRWSHELAPNSVKPISAGWSALYYVRGSYQVLAISREVGWHPDYLEHLKDDT